MLDQVQPELTKLVIVDLRELEFMDSTGLSIIVRAHQRLSEHGCELTLIKGPPQVQRLLDLTGVADRLRSGSEPGELLDERSHGWTQSFHSASGSSQGRARSRG